VHDELTLHRSHCPLLGGLRRTVLRVAAQLSIFCAILLGVVSPAIAGPPYKSDDPEATDYRHFEIYTFSNGTVTRDGTSGEAGIDFNYGAAPNLQLTAVLPAGFAFAAGSPTVTALSNIEVAAKYRFLTQDIAGFDVAVFPRLFLPSASSAIGERHASLLLPIWLERDWGQWSAFGGGGCEINRGGSSQDFCEMGLAITRQIVPNLQLGLEIFHQTPDTQSGVATTSLGVGVRYDLNDNFHLLGYLGRGIQNVEQTDQFNWYTSILFTF
jgi:Putative MetA-pathway of phenol degradation